MRKLAVLLVGMGLLLSMLGTAAAAAEKPPATVKPEEIAKITAAMPTQATAKPAKARKLLVFTLTKGFPHSSVPVAAAAFEIMGQKTGAFQATISNDPAVFTADNLKNYDAVMMDNTTGELFTDEASKKALIDFVKGGKGLGGSHAATDCFYKWAEFGEMMGGYFAGHPFRKISVKIDDPANPINAAFAGKGFEISDEIYTFKEPYSREKLHILLSIDWENAGLKGGTRQDNDYALAWIQEFGQGRVFYCAFGHDHQIFWNPVILKHYLDGIQYMLGDLKANATPTAKLNPAPAAARGPVLAPPPEKKETPKPAAAPAVNKAPRILNAPAAAEAGFGLKPDAQGWIMLFDGKNLDAWQKPAADKWKIVDGVMTWEKGCGDIWSKDKFGDFILDLEFKVTKGTNSGVFLRTADIKNWLHTGFEIQVMDSFGKTPGKHDCGALYDCLAPSINAEKATGEWNHYVITMKGNSLKIELNDKTILEADLNKWTEAHKNPDGSPNKFNIAYKDMAKEGVIGLQDHGAAVWYRNVKVKSLTAAAK